jgi:hypothetical protein
MFDKFSEKINKYRDYSVEYVFYTPELYKIYTVTENTQEIFNKWKYIANEMLKEKYISLEYFNIVTEYIDDIFKLTWTEFSIERGNDEINKIINLLIEGTNNKNNKDIIYFKNIYIKWIDNIKQCTFQGGYGYSFHTTDLTCHHQCIKPEFFEKYSKIDNDILVGHILLKKYIIMSKTCCVETWGN